MKHAAAEHYLNGRRTAENYIDECILRKSTEPDVLYRILIQMTQDDEKSSATLRGFTDCIQSWMRAGRAAENPSKTRADTASGVLVAAPPPLTEAMIDAARQHITNGDDEESARDPYEVRGRIVAIYRSFFGNPVTQAAEPKSQVGNFGDSSAEQFRRAVEGPHEEAPEDYSKISAMLASGTGGFLDAEKFPQVFEQLGMQPPSNSNMQKVHIAPASKDSLPTEQPIESNVQKVHIPPTSANFARVQTDEQIEEIWNSLGYRTRFAPYMLRLVRAVQSHASDKDATIAALSVEIGSLKHDLRQYMDIASAEASLAEELRKDAATLTTIRAAVNGYYFALVKRQHGSVAQTEAFDKIEQALDMHESKGKN